MGGQKRGASPVGSDHQELARYDPRDDLRWYLVALDEGVRGIRFVTEGSAEITGAKLEPLRQIAVRLAAFAGSGIRLKDLGSGGWWIL
jgi:hypothetical protein